MGRRGRRFRWWCWIAGCGFLHLLNVFLAFVAVMLTGLVTLNSIQREVPLPVNLTQWTMNKVLGDSHQADWSRAVFDLRGGLYLTDFRLTQSRKTESVLEAEMIRLDVSFFDLIFGNEFPIDEIHATGVSLFISASKSPSGLNEPVLQISHAHLLRENHQLVVDYLNVQANGLRLFISGSSPLEPLLERGRKSDALPSTDLLSNLLAEIHGLPDDIDLDCLVDWSVTDQNVHEFDLLIQSDGLVLEMAKIENVSLGARVRLAESDLSLTQLDGQAVLTFINPNTIPEALVPWPLAPPVPVSFSASGAPVPTKLLNCPRNLQLRIMEPFSQQLPVSVLIAETSLGIQNPEIHWTIGGLNLFASGTARQQNAPIQPDQPPPPWQIDARADFHEPILHAFFPNIDDHRLLQDAHAGHLRLNASFSTDDQTARGILFSDDLYIGRTHFAHLKSEFSISKSDLAFTRIHVQRSSNEWAQGSYFQHVPSSRFSLNAYGSSLPRSLDSILGSWWHRIFTHVEVAQPPQADVTVWGQWGRRDSLKSMTHVVGKGVRYRGIPTEELSVRVRSNGEWAYLEKLEGVFPSGRIRGSLAWKTREEGRHRRAMLMDLRSDAPWTAVVGASGVGALEALNLTGNPVLHVEGVLWNEDGGPESEKTQLIPDLRIDLSHRDATSVVGGWEMTGLSLAGQVTREQIDIERMSGTLAGGIFTGSLDIRDWQDPERRTRHLSLQLIDAGYAEVLRQAIREGQESALFEEALMSDTGRGRIDTSLDLWLGRELIDNHGSGQITMRKAEIGQIHLFGGLSRFLSGIGMGFSTLNLDSGSIDWELEDGVLTIPSCLLSGSVLNLNLAGNVDIVEKRLDLQADAYFFKGLVSRMLTPVSDNFQFDIKGPLENPIWKIRLNPLRWFQNRFPLPSEPKPFQTAPE